MRGYLTVFLFTVLCFPLFGQSVDGVITSGEYGTHTIGVNIDTSGGDTFFIKNTTDTIFIGIQGADVTEGAVIYFDINPSPSGRAVDTRDLTYGNTEGFDYDNVEPLLPFAADALLYFKDDSCELRYSDNAGNWKITSGGINCADNGSNIIEISLKWAAVDSSGSMNRNVFNLLTYKMGSSSVVYSQLPFRNPTGTASSPNFFEYYTVTDSIIFKNRSYTCPPDSSGNSILEDSSYYDLTMNNDTATLIKNSLTRLRVGRNLGVYRGEINLGTSNSPLNDTIGGDIYIDTFGTLKLSSGNSKLSMGRNFTGGAAAFTNEGAFDANGSSVSLDDIFSVELYGNFGINSAFYDLVINSAGVFGVFSYADTVQISNGLELNGTLSLHSNSICFLEDNATITPDGGSSTLYIDGTVFWEIFGTSEKIFPLGDLDQLEWGRVGITPQTSETGRVYKAKYVFENYSSEMCNGNTTWDVVVGTPQLHHASSLEYWDLGVRNSSNKDARIKMFFEASSEVGTQPDSLLVAHYKEDSCKFEGLDTNAIYYASSDSGWVQSVYTDIFSPFTIGTKTLSNPLPITLLSFEAHDLGGQQVEVNWKTSTEKNSDFFEIWCSINGDEYIPLHIENARYMSNEIAEYSFLHSLNAKPISISYILKAYDLDRTYQTYGPARVDFNNRDIVSIHPNPVKEGILNIQLAHAKDQVKRLSIYSPNGVVVYESESPSLRHDLSSLSPGYYFVQVESLQSKVQLPLIIR